MPSLSQMVVDLKMSGIREIMDLSAEMNDVIHLEVGEPLFNTPPHITAAALAAAEAGYTKYTPNKGLLSLRGSIVERLNSDYDIAFTTENVVVTVGGVGGIFTAVCALVDQGDEVLIPDPGWPTYEMIIHCAGALYRRYPLDPERNFLPSVSSIEQLITTKTKILLLNTPSNPLGVVIPGALLEELVDLARRRDIYIISDEVYNKIVFDDKHVSALTFDTDERVVGIFSFSKNYAMTGWRVGYAVASEAITSQATKLQEAHVSCASSVSQKAAEAALLSSQDCIETMRQTYRDNLVVAREVLDQFGFKYQIPRGAFYIWIDVNSRDSAEFAKNFLTKNKVAVAPGTTFGPSGKSYIRISLASDRESIREGLRRLGSFRHE